MSKVTKGSSKRLASIVIAVLAAAQLTGCGGSSDSRSDTPPTNTGGNPSGGNGGNNNGGGNNGGDTGNNPPADVVQGVFVDAPVAGLAYRTSSGLEGFTDSEGRYNYVAGDTVTFSIGALELGTVTAQGVVTPMTVATALSANASVDAATIAANVAVLLQSLDDDGNPDNGITVTKSVRDAITTAAIDVTASESTFTASIGGFIANVSAAAQTTLTAVDRADALEHFVSNGKAGLAGHYVRADENFEPITQKIVTLTIFRNGSYLLGGQYDDSQCDQYQGVPTHADAFSDAKGNGVEYATYAWDPLTNEFEVTLVKRETDGGCGLNRPVVDAENDIGTLEATPQGLVFKDRDGEVAYRFVRMEQDANTFQGSWIQPGSLLTDQPFVFSFFPSTDDGLSGRYLMVDASRPEADEDTTPGIEEGCYSVNADDALTVELNGSVCADAIDTNDTAGLSDTGALTMFIDENDRLVIDDGEGRTALTRIPLPTIDRETLAGAWILEQQTDVKLGEQDHLFMLTFFEDGTYLMGGQENDASCLPVGYPHTEFDDQGNGVEFGTTTLVNGVLTPTATVETNGECGMFDAKKEFVQRYMFVPNAAGDALVMWSNDDDTDEGLVWKRVPSTPNSIYGAWKWEDLGDNEIAVTAYLPGDVMFETAVLEGETGIRREKFDYSAAPLLRSQTAGYEQCVDTQTDSDCEGDEPAFIEDTVIIDGDEMSDEFGVAARRITKRED